MNAYKKDEKNPQKKSLSKKHYKSQATVIPNSNGSKVRVLSSYNCVSIWIPQKQRSPIRIL